MASCNGGVTCGLKFVLLLQVSLILLPLHVRSDNDGENNLLQGLNSYRTSLQLPALTKNKQAGCLADELADELEDRPCVATTAANAIPAGVGSNFINYPKLLKKCNIDPNTTTNGIILPVCVPKLVPTLVLTNYTRTGYARYINDSRFTGAGVGSEDDWIVVVLSTSTVGGSFASNAVGLSVALPLFVGALTMLMCFL